MNVELSEHLFENEWKTKEILNVTFTYQQAFHHDERD